MCLQQHQQEQEQATSGLEVDTMADSKKYDGSTWVHSLRKLTTATEAVENPLYSDGTAITAYTIKGNTVQTSIPTPSNPIMPQGCGEKTAQLYNSADTIWILGILDDNGQNTGATTSHYTGNFTEVNANKSYAIGGTLGVGSNQYRIYFYDTEKRWISRTPPKEITKNSFTTPVNCKYIQIQVVVAVESTTDWMLNEGSTAKPFEPWGYKIPISNGQQTTNIYLGSIQTRRQIKKLVLTGDENLFVYQGLGYIRLSDGLGARIAPYSDKLLGTDVATANMPVFSIAQAPSDITPAILAIKADSNFQSSNAFKTWLAENQITVWYVLAAAETATVNEPLMKIGDYADTLSNATAIPTTDGANSITVSTTVQPSEFIATWTGWHDASVKEWDGSQWS